MKPTELRAAAKKEVGLRGGELQMFWEGAEWLKSHLQKRLLSKGNRHKQGTKLSI